MLPQSDLHLILIYIKHHICTLYRISSFFYQQSRTYEHIRDNVRFGVLPNDILTRWNGLNWATDLSIGGQPIFKHSFFKHSFYCHCSIMRFRKQLMMDERIYNITPSVLTAAWGAGVTRRLEKSYQTVIYLSKEWKPYLI